MEQISKSLATPQAQHQPSQENEAMNEVYRRVNALREHDETRGVIETWTDISPTATENSWTHPESVERLRDEMGVVLNADTSEDTLAKKEDEMTRTCRMTLMITLKAVGTKTKPHGDIKEICGRIQVMTRQAILNKAIQVSVEIE